MNIEQCEKARLSRDARFDGSFYTAVLTTGIFCRPICPARPPKPENVHYYKTAAQAMEAGYVPCKRCLPERAPTLSNNKETSKLLHLLESSDLTIAQIAEHFNLSERQLRRKTLSMIGISPMKYRQNQKLLFAQNLLKQTNLSVTDIGFAAGFNSIRQFNHAFQQQFKTAPSDVKRSDKNSNSTTINLLLPYRPPYDWHQMMSFISQRLIEEYETVDNGYTRYFKIDAAKGWFKVTHVPTKNAIEVEVNLSDYSYLKKVLSHVRRMFDIDCDWQQVFKDLSHHSQLKLAMDKYPGMRLPGNWDPFEFSIRAILGQQISVKAATTLAHRIVRKFGTTIDIDGNEVVLFPSVEELKGVDFSAIGVTRKRNDTLRNWVQFYQENAEMFAQCSDLTAFVKTLCAQPGIGEWTAHYIAMRGLSFPDAFPASDLGILKALDLTNKPKEIKVVKTLAEQWRPWRSYATIYLWQSLKEE